MDRIYMTCFERHPEKDQVKIAVFLQGSEAHVNELIGFLKNQKIPCRRFTERDRKRIEEFTLFDHGFIVTTTASGWSFYELRNYIQTYANTWDDDYMLRDSPIHELQTCNEDRDFDHEFYVELCKQIDAVEDRYFQAGNNISHFFDGILKLIRNNLDLYWVAAEYLDAGRNRISYQNHVPASLDKRDVITRINRKANRNIIHREICFDGGEVLAHLHLNPGPFSPKRSVINSFLDLIVTHIDDFLHGIISHKREIMELQNEISRLKQASSPQAVITPEQTRRIKGNIRLILIGSSPLKDNVILAIIRKMGYSNLVILSDYKKIKNWDGNTLLKHRSGYDGILLGPMPHSTHGSGNGHGLIQRIINEPDRYPPTVQLNNNNGHLVISKSSIASGINELERQLQEMTMDPALASSVN